MTSLAFGFGVLPLAIGTGAGAGGRQSIGTAVLGGMVVGTALGIFFVPLFFVVVQRLFNRSVNEGNRSANDGRSRPLGGTTSGNTHEGDTHE
jgi:multidrug efflux pump